MNAARITNWVGHEFAAVMDNSNDGDAIGVVRYLARGFNSDRKRRPPQPGIDRTRACMSLKDASGCGMSADMGDFISSHVNERWRPSPSDLTCGGAGGSSVISGR